MVMRLPMPQHCSINLVGNVVREREGGVNAEFFNGIRVEWETRTEAYIEHCGSPEHVLPWTAIPVERKKSFLNLYLSPNEGSSQLVVLKELRGHSLNHCPSCGEFGRPNTLDHYLPKGKYPHFCITPVNLFPMCDRCQGEKLEKTSSAVEPRLFLHPYYDAFIAEQVMRVVVEPPYGAPTFRIEIAAELSAGQRSVVSSHIRELEIEQRFAHFFKEESIRVQKLAASMRAANIQVSHVLHGFERSYRTPSLNTWQHLYYSSVVENIEMLDYLENGDLPSLL